MTTEQLIENLGNLLGENGNNNENSDEFDDLFEEAYLYEAFNKNSNFEETKKKLYYFISIISKENIKFNKDELKNISNEILKSLDINSDDLFLIQNSPIDNFVKSFNFQQLSLRPSEMIPPISKIYELQTIKYKFLINELKIKGNFFDNTGNFLIPNSRKNKFRGKEIYDPPYNWIGVGLNVLGKYDNGNDNWIEDISKESEWAIAYRGISYKNQNVLKMILKDFIENRNLEIANVNIKDKFGKLNDKRHWRTIESGIYMTPYIKVAEKYTQTLSFNNKNYKVLLMAKVKISGIAEPKGTNYWVLDKENIRIYRVLFKEIN